MVMSPKRNETVSRSEMASGASSVWKSVKKTWKNVQNKGQAVPSGVGAEYGRLALGRRPDGADVKMLESKTRKHWENPENNENIPKLKGKSLRYYREL